MINNNLYKPPHNQDLHLIPDIQKITDDTNRCIIISKHKLSLNRMSLHNEKCDCHIPENVSVHYNSEYFYLFRSKKNKRIWYVLKKSVMPEIIERCINIFPCRTYNGRQQTNGFPWIVTKSYEDLLNLKSLCDKVMEQVESLGHSKRDYHRAEMIPCPSTRCKKHTLTDIKSNLGKIYYGFTSPYIPTDGDLYVLGIVQKKVGKYKYNHFNAPGGKKDMLWNSKAQKFYVEKLIDSVIRETWEELGIEFDKDFFNNCLDLSRKNDIKPVNYTRDRSVIVYNIYLPKLDVLKFEVRDWDDPERCRYFVSWKI